MVRMKELPVGLRAVGSFVNYNAGHAEARLANHSEQLAHEALIEIRVAEPPKHTFALDEILPMKTNERVVRMPFKDTLLQLVQRLGKIYVWDVHIEPDPQQAQIALVVVVRELERMVAGLVNVKPVALGTQVY